MKRVGIYSGAFDPVHSGHLGFGLQAVQAAQLDELHFLPERQPRHKKGVEHFGHRVAMLKQALRPYRRFDVLQLHDINFTVQGTLPRLQKRFGNSQLVMLMGSDVARHIQDWPQADKLLKQVELVIGLRDGQAEHHIKQQIENWPAEPRAVYIFESFAPDITSRQVREGLLKRQPRKGLLSSVQKYSDKHWLYVSFAA